MQYHDAPRTIAAWDAVPDRTSPHERAHHVLAYISRLYEVERATRNCDAATRQAKRAEHAAPLLAELGTWLESQEFLPKSLIGKAATYTRNQWTALNRYVEDGDLSIDNNFAERRCVQSQWAGKIGYS